MIRFVQARPCLALVSVALLLAASMLGCSKGPEKTYPTTGVVTFPDGEPVMTGTIELRRKDTPFNARGKINRNGTFALGTFDVADGAVAGVHEAVVIQVFATGRTPNIVHDHGDVVAASFADYETSGLEFTIKPEKNELKVVVERKK